MGLPAPFDLLPTLLLGLEITLKLTLTGAALALLVAIVAGVLRASPFWIVRAVVGFYIEVFRGTSVLVQMFWVFYVFPRLFDLSLGPFEAGVLALGLNVGAYGAEVVRSSIAAVPKGQTEAAVALNMTPFLRLRRVIFPQAVRMMIPPLGNLLIELLKVTSLASFITIAELTFQARQLRLAAGSRSPEIFSMLLLVYFVIAYTLTLGVRYLERRFSRGFTAGGH